MRARCSLPRSSISAPSQLIRPSGTWQPPEFRSGSIARSIRPHWLSASNRWQGDAPMADSEREAKVTGWLTEQQPAMLALLRDVVNIDSGSYDKAGVDAVGARFERFFHEQGLLTRREPQVRFGDAIHVRLDDRPMNEKPILLMGHRDTVFPKGEAGRRPFKSENARAYGPGVADMKAGLVINAFVLAAFRKFGGASSPLAG